MLTLPGTSPHGVSVECRDGRAASRRELAPL